jgi:hypothetical protein
MRPFCVTAELIRERSWKRARQTFDAEEATARDDHCDAARCSVEKRD